MVLPVLLLLVWQLAGALGHAVFLFLTASVIAFLLNPVVRSLQELRIRRGLGVAVVYLTFAAAVVALIVALGTVVVEQTRSAADRVDAHLTDEPGCSGDSAFDRDIADFEEWLLGVLASCRGPTRSDGAHRGRGGPAARGECPLGVMTGVSSRRCCARLAPCGRKAERA